jgi:hypothetical protein
VTNHRYRYQNLTFVWAVRQRIGPALGAMAEGHRLFNRARLLIQAVAGMSAGYHHAHAASKNYAEIKQGQTCCTSGNSEISSPCIFRPPHLKWSDNWTENILNDIPTVHQLASNVHRIWFQMNVSMAAAHVPDICSVSLRMEASCRLQLTVVISGTVVCISPDSTRESSCFMATHLVTIVSFPTLSNYT